MKESKLVNKPAFVISLDFELMWGVFDKRSISNYRQNIEGVFDAIPEMLKLFEKYEVNCTWAIVGMLYFENLAELKKSLPSIQPSYSNPNYSAYLHINSLDDSSFKKYYSGLELIKKIKQFNAHEIATHTFSHYYCLEDGQSLDEFRTDLKMALKLGEKNGIKIKTIIFPRNQYDANCLDVCCEEGLRYFRGTETSFFQKPRAQNKLNLLIRTIRLIDTYLNLSGHNVYRVVELWHNKFYNIPSSFFFRPYNKALSIFEALKLARYKKAMLYAAKNKSIFHLWWHPHNFGTNTRSNILQLEELLKYYKFLNKKYGMINITMNQVSDIL